MNKIKWFDVCNDYSLDPRDKPEDLHLYKTQVTTEDGYRITSYYHKQHDELHYQSMQKI
jgi:hypothetical protein